ncbi:MAG TPA: DOMON-like domain-containing protein [Allosphingosinicella sp.]|jgi:hypothetical protein|nr:DOMON-like domain-containing protein [Allosphingosinicella sp.]
MPRALTRHPESAGEAVTGIEVDVARQGEVLGLRWIVTGRIAGLALPRRVASRHSDRLWEHTCFEAFFADEEGGAYSELNVSPSTEWAAYRFNGYREGMRSVDLPAPRIEIEAGEDRLEVRVALKLRTAGHRRLGLSAIVEEANGAKSWWALAHPPGAPDFHHADCFQIDLPPLGEA